MIIEAATLTCSICGEPSSEICVYCTKDSCRNHRCERCKRCSDCCECEIPLSAAEPEVAPPLEEHVIEEVPVAEPVVEAAMAEAVAPEAEPPEAEPIPHFDPPPAAEPEPEA